MDLMTRRRMMMAKKALPYDSEVEYLENTGGSYINTGIKPSSTTRVTAKLKYTIKIFSNAFASRNTATAGAGYCFGMNGTSYISDYGGNRQIFSSAITSDPQIVIVDKNKNVCSIDINGVVESKTNASSTFSVSYNLILFGLNSAGTITSTKSRFYYCKIWENNTLVRDFIPVRVGTVGYMYDKVSKQLFGNSGSNSFAIGNDVN